MIMNNPVQKFSFHIQPKLQTESGADTIDRDQTYRFGSRLRMKKTKFLLKKRTQMPKPKTYAHFQPFSSTINTIAEDYKKVATHRAMHAMQC